MCLSIPEALVSLRYKLISAFGLDKVASDGLRARFCASETWEWDAVKSAGV